MRRTLSAICVFAAVVAALSALAQQGVSNPRSRLLRNPVQAQRQAATPDTSAGATAGATGSAAALNWDAAPVDIVLQAYGERVNKTILKDPALPTATISQDP